MTGGRVNQQGSDDLLSGKGGADVITRLGEIVQIALWAASHDPSDLPSRGELMQDPGDEGRACSTDSSSNGEKPK